MTYKPSPSYDDYGDYDGFSLQDGDCAICGKLSTTTWYGVPIHYACRPHVPTGTVQSWATFYFQTNSLDRN